jgi:hypothetical protein
MTDIGDLIRFGNPSLDEASVAFTDITATPTNPTTVTLEITKPDGTKLTYGWPGAGPDGSLTNESPGRFYYAVLIDQSGPWQYRLAGLGAVAAASEGVLRVTPRMVV